MNAMTKNVLGVFAQRIYDIQFAEITNNAKKKAVDMDCRIVSDFLGTGNDNVSHSTPHIIKNCKYWTSDAKKLYKFLQESLSISHYQICEVYANHASGDYTLFHHTTKREEKKAFKRAFAVEHQYPIGIVKERVVNKQFASVKVVENYLKKYNNIVIVTSRENEMLNEQFKSAKTLEEAEERYKKLGIVVEEFDATMNGSSLQEFFI